jgi:23S rRNA pseudouridine1911/1915/1917 synthase
MFPEFTRLKVREYIDAGMVFLNKKRIWIAKYKVQTGDLMEVNTENGDNQKTEFSTKNIIFENSDFLIVNKPAGMIMEDIHHNFPILDAIRKLTNPDNLPTIKPKTSKPQSDLDIQKEVEANLEEQLFIVHKIDKETSGLVIIAKRKVVQDDLMYLWSEKKIQKIYQVLCLNKPLKMQGHINTNVGQHVGRAKYGILDKKEELGKTALTYYKVNALIQKNMACIMSVEPKTGRSHQIRVHLASIDCPIIGDKIYGTKFKANPLYQISNRQMLHASQLVFELYGNKYNFHAPVPSDFNQIIKFIKTSKPKEEIREPKVKLKADPKRIKKNPTKRRKQGETAMRNKTMFTNKSKKY